MRFPSTCAFVLGAALFAAPAIARPIAYADSTTLMTSWVPDAEFETLLLYAPEYWLSFGPTHMRVQSHDGRHERRYTTFRVNGLAKRWNLPRAQANAFGWASLGGVSGTGLRGSQTVWNAGLQLDYETRRVYFAAQTDWYRSRDTRHRFDQFQAGIAPYEHDVDVVATWFVAQAERSTGVLDEGTDYSLLLRLFKGTTWVEAGVGEGGKLVTYFMYTF